MTRKSEFDYVADETTIEQLESDNQRLRVALDELLSVAERVRGGDPNLDPEEWYAARDFARIVLGEGA